MSNTVTSYILVHDGGKLTVEDVNLAVHGVHPLPTYGSEEENYYSARQSKDSKWIKVRTKWSAPVGAMAQLAYEKGINLTMEFRLAGQLRSRQHAVLPQACGARRRRVALGLLRPGAVPQELLDMAAKVTQRIEEETRKAFGVEEAQ